MPYANLLHIYDADDWVLRQSAPYRAWHESDVKQVGVSGGIKGLVRELDNLLNNKWTFPRVLFYTHGNSGLIAFDKERLTQNEMIKNFANRGYERLFPMVQSQMYFNGCKVADGDAGWNFLETAASIFLKTGGGVAFGHTSKGFAMHPIVIPFTGPIVFYFVGGKSLHFWGDTRYVFVGPGGNFVKREVT